MHIFFLREREVKHQHRLPREFVETPSLDTVKAQLNMVLGNLLHLPPFEQGLGLPTISRAAFQSQQVCDPDRLTMQQLTSPGQGGSPFNIHILANCCYVLFGRQRGSKRTTPEEVGFSGLLIKVTDSRCEKASPVVTVTFCYAAENKYIL